MPDIDPTLERAFRGVNNNAAMFEHIRKVSAAVDVLRADNMRLHAEIADVRKRLAEREEHRHTMPAGGRR